MKLKMKVVEMETPQVGKLKRRNDKISGKNVKKKESTAAATASASSSSEPFELEQQFILRLPQDAATCLHEDLKETSNVQIKDKLFVEMDYDMRHGRVRYGGDIFFAKLLDMPTIIESLKTVDKKTFYKAADVCQMLLCKRDEEWIQDETESTKKKDKEKKYVWNHGVSPSLKNVRKRRFRKTLKKKYMDQPEVEKEVRRLFRYDSDAVDVKYEIIIDDEKSLLESGQPKSLESGAKPHAERGAEDSTSLDVASYFGELSSSEEEEEDEKDINIMDSGEEDASRGPSTPKPSTSLGDQGLMENSEGTGMTDSDTAELQDKLKELVKQLEEIRERRSYQEDQLATLEDDDLKGEMQEALNKVVNEENEKERELEILSAMLNQ